MSLERIPPKTSGFSPIAPKEGEKPEPRATTKVTALVLPIAINMAGAKPKAKRFGAILTKSLGSSSTPNRAKAPSNILKISTAAELEQITASRPEITRIECAKGVLKELKDDAFMEKFPSLKAITFEGPFPLKGSPLHEVIAAGHERLVQFFIKTKAHELEDTTALYGDTPLILAIRQNDRIKGKSFIRLLLEAGASLRIPE